MLSLMFALYVFLGLAPQSLAWQNNGWQKAKLGLEPEKWSQDYWLRNYEHYGTHDYIAHKAWDLTVDNPSNRWLTRADTPYHNERTFAFFMIGTEVPDYAQDHCNHEIIADKECGGVILSQIICQFTTSHNCYLDDQGELTRRSTYSAYYCQGAIYGVQKAFSRAMYYFKQGKCEAAAYCMGVLTHYIADVSCYPHTIPQVLSEHTSYELAVLKYTNRPYTTNINFDLNKHGWSGALKHPEECVYLTARKTRLGTSGAKSANWMHQQWVDNIITPENFPNRYDPDFEEYFNTIEINLNTAVYYCSAALQFIYDQVNTCFGGISCSCEPHEQTLTEEVLQSVMDAIEDVASNMSVAWAYAYIGKIISVFSLAITGADNALENVSNQSKAIEKLLMIFKKIKN